MSNHLRALADNLNNLGKLHHFQGHYAKAEECFIDAWRIYNPTLNLADVNERDERVAPIISNLAKLYDDMGNYESAHLYYLQAVTIIKKIPVDMLGCSIASGFATTLNNLGAFYHQKWHDYNKAAAYYNHAESMSSRIFGEHSPETVRIQACHAQLLLDQALDKPEDRNNRDRYIREVEVRYQETVRAYELALERGGAYASIHLATWYNNLAAINQLCEEPERARLQYELALQIYLKKGWTSHFSYAVLLTNYAKLLQYRGDRGGANSWYRKAESIYRDTGGGYYKYYQVADFLGDYAQFFLETANYDKAMKLLENAIDIYSCQVPCSGHDNVTHVLRNYQELSRQQLPGYKAPEELYHRMLAAYEKYEAQSDPLVANVQSCFASYLASRGHYPEACQYYEKAFANYNKALNVYVSGSVLKDGWLEVKPALALTYGKEVRILENIEPALKDYAQLLTNRRASRNKLYPVEQLYDKALGTFQSLLADDHWLMADVYGGYSRCLEKIDRKKAGETGSDARKIRDKYKSLPNTYLPRSVDHSSIIL